MQDEFAPDFISDEFLMGMEPEDDEEEMTDDEGMDEDDDLGADLDTDEDEEL